MSKFQTVVILDLYEADFHAVAILSHWPWIFIQVDPQHAVLAPVRTSEEPVRQVPRTTIRPTLIQIILADSIIVKFEVGVGGGWRRDRGGASVFSCKLSSSKNQSSEVAMWRLYRTTKFRSYLPATCSSQATYIRVGKTGSLGPWSRVIVYCC